MTHTVTILNDFNINCRLTEKQ